MNKEHPPFANNEYQFPPDFGFATTQGHETGHHNGYDTMPKTTPSHENKDHPPPQTPKQNPTQENYNKMAIIGQIQGCNQFISETKALVKLASSPVVQHTNNSRNTLKCNPLTKELIVKLDDMYSKVKVCMHMFEDFIEAELKDMKKNSATSLGEQMTIVRNIINTKEDFDDVRHALILFIAMIDMFVQVVNDVFECVDEWSDMSSNDAHDLKRNLLIFLDLIDSKANFFITIEMFYNSYYNGKSKMEGATQWNKSAKQRMNHMAKMYNSINNKTASKNGACVIS